MFASNTDRVYKGEFQLSNQPPSFLKYVLKVSNIKRVHLYARKIFKMRKHFLLLNIVYIYQNITKMNLTYNSYFADKILADTEFD